MRRWLGGSTEITAGDNTAMTSADLLSRLAGTRPRKLIGSGYSMVAGIDRDRGRDVLIADVTSKPFAVSRIRYFTDARGT